MESLFLLLPVSFLFVIGIGIALYWAVFSGQFDDTEENGKSILEDNDSNHT
ncbi:cbb3-type cytochrome oxidase assembly protein CcoS [Advenella sp. WQ 585]|uniref:Outer membrane protein n=2 Tax=Advenella TaxID=290425 RepID=A0A918JDV7_9BURK|nr:MULTISPECIES: cbb3-type cytochrome oxidase assembly protein CcoS [Advenella]MBK1782133.1 cbb3-type cytochrome oxidase assembly protein CcoS [Advenella mandrilli]MDY0272495.1 cbb3-type cytochrome oxidase assembly protein CcoS [Advenella sp.]NLY33990.1 cbb3-type cytochrome oxidase assembly protein CcoS [Alcaligenaceae bacterium]GGW76061.1 outer membrane protein [Advenella faeciporci]